jgi:hypothetical protein
LRIRYIIRIVVADTGVAFADTGVVAEKVKVCIDAEGNYSRLYAGQLLTSYTYITVLNYVTSTEEQQKTSVR